VPDWAALWLDSLGAAWGTRLKRGAALERAGAVADLHVRSAGATATVADPTGPSRRVRLAVRPLTGAEWARAATVLVSDPALAAALDAGDLPAEAAPALAAAGVALLPVPADLAVDCLCGDRVPCRHVAALAYALAATVAADPWQLALLRGRARAALLADLAAARAALVPEAQSSVASRQSSVETAADSPTQRSELRNVPAAPLRDENSNPQSAIRNPQSCWGLGPTLAEGAVPIAAPPQAAPALRQLGPPPFWTPPAAFAAHLEPVYESVTAAILALLTEDDPADQKPES
jgi:uncharacterized Zn finger protein